MSVIQTMPGHLIRRLNQISVSIFQARIAELGLDLTPVQFAALASLRDNPGIDQATLAGLIAHDRVTMGGVIDRLQAKGLVLRMVNSKDRRARQVSLTVEGHALIDRLLPEIDAIQSDILCGLNPDEQVQFTALATKAMLAANERSRAPMRPRD
ncbi:MarR family winged helix-turn-helix transcriptional regulator [Pararhodobacter zhoushanensis]|uniref:MarR family winged helix-turn-helix transcriptional regulator n=1 Tax=Pararhodobacter zhoushanensis TaxID=2479545 RepID=UPI000F8EC397|nr:MarR family transcriptional regulator [Pararhodobacter zhoushanensis]